MSEELERDVNEACAPAVAEIWGSFLNLYRGLCEPFGGPEGLKAAIAEARAEKEAWEAEHPGVRYEQECHCMCRAAGHDGGTCLGDATTTDLRVFDGKPIAVPVCDGCAAAIAERNSL